MYVTDLVVADTVNTMPEKTLEAFADHGEVQRRPGHRHGATRPSAVFDRLARRRHRLRRRDRGPRGARASRSSRSPGTSCVETVERPDGAGRPVTDGAGRPTHDRGVGTARRRSPTAFAPDLRAWFADDPGARRPADVHAGDLHVDLSKNLVTDDVLAALLGAGRAGRARRTAATRCSRGEHINVTEDRAVLHTALRLPARRRRSRSTARTSSPTCTRCCAGSTTSPTGSARGAWTGVTGERIRTVVNIGIGGSDLGPVMAYEALAAVPPGRPRVPVRLQHRPDRRRHDAGRPRPGDARCSSSSSKTFGTLETLTNARLCKAWLLDGAGRADDDASERRRQALRRGLDRPRQGRRRSASTRPTRSASGTGSAAATPSTPRSARRSSSRSGRSGSPSSWPASTRSTSTSARTELGAQRAGC